MTDCVSERGVIKSFVDDFIQCLFRQLPQRIHVAENTDVHRQQRSLKLIGRIGLHEYLPAGWIKNADVDDGVRFPSHVLAAVQLFDHP